MQILKRTDYKGFEKAKELGPEKLIEKVIVLLKDKGLTGRGGAGFSTGKKWEFTYNTKVDEKFVICNADEGEPGAFKDKFILMYNPEALIEGIIIAANTIGAKQSFIYLRGEYEYLEKNLRKVIDEAINKTCFDGRIDIVVGAGAYICGDETAIIRSIEGKRGHPYYKPPFPPIEGLYGKPTIINNVETLANVPQAILFDDWNKSLRLMSVSGNLGKSGLIELPYNTKLFDVIERCEPKGKIKAVYFGCFGGCMPYENIELLPENVAKFGCAVGSYTMVAVDENHSIFDVSLSIAKFYVHESCGKCTPCREGTFRVLELLNKIDAGNGTKEDLDTLNELAEHIRDTSLCGLGQTATIHLINGLKYFRDEFEAKIKK
jgi:NADH:ubiquinone oxidoreductase subunit F (NADH-binding)